MKKKTYILQLQIHHLHLNLRTLKWILLFSLFAKISKQDCFVNLKFSFKYYLSIKTLCLSWKIISLIILQNNIHNAWKLFTRKWK
ncbi:unnamed protein product [Blepharisma stoltei]|uniref:Uncharacterized protein n=1 Tax=Blepharisma stoltei TaxID=1481888 RepID=A0AAU9JSM0_9CILI|nr:unnamed protein product [Blepharisma stoltei]